MTRRSALALALAVAALVAGATGRTLTASASDSAPHVLKPAEGSDSARAKPCGGGDDEVCSLPGLNGPPHVRMRSGYITVSEVSDRQLWYLVADREEEESPERRRANTATDQKHDDGGDDDGGVAPVLLWLTGGPGCSSLDAFVYEHGPFKLDFAAPGGKGAAGTGEGAGAGEGQAEPEIVLTPNPYSWTKAATVIYVDSPAGAGMSFSGRPDVDYHTDDDYTIADLITFLKGLTKRYPELATSPFFIAGESYAGVYVPKLARAIVAANEQREEAGKVPLVHLRGYAVGNPVTDDVIDGNAQLIFAADMGFMDPPTWRAIQAACPDGMYWNATTESDCYQSQRTVLNYLWDINWYDVLDVCVPDYDYARAASSSSSSGGDTQQQQQQQRRQLLQAAAAAAAAPGARRGAWWLPGRVPAEVAASARGAAEEVLNTPEGARRVGQRLWGPWLRHVAPCLDRKVAISWLNRDEVRAALHAAPSSAIGGWQPCSDVLYYALDTAELVPLHEELAAKGLRIMVYSGDHDMVVPHTGTRTWVYDKARLGGAKDVMRPWLLDGQVGGFSARFRAGAGRGLLFATVRGSGHMVPQSKPREALHLLHAFLRDAKL